MWLRMESGVPVKIDKDNFRAIAMAVRQVRD
jgi:hypothetical protein